MAPFKQPMNVVELLPELRLAGGAVAGRHGRCAAVERAADERGGNAEAARARRRARRRSSTRPRRSRRRRARPSRRGGRAPATAVIVRGTGPVPVRVLRQHDGGAADAAGDDGERPVLRIADDRDRGVRGAGRRAGAASRAPRRARAARRCRCADRTSTTSARYEPRLPGICTDVSCSPATTCAAVTTRCGVANQPLPSMPTPHALPDDPDDRPLRALRPRGGAAIAALGGAAGAAGPAIDGNGSIRASSPRSRRGEHLLVEPADDRRALHLAAQPRLPGNEERGRAGDPDERDAHRRAERDAAERVEEAERREPEPAAHERADDAGDRLEHERPDDGADEARERRPGETLRRR